MIDKVGNAFKDFCIRPLVGARLVVTPVIFNDDNTYA